MASSSASSNQDIHGFCVVYAELRWAMSQETCGDCMTSFFPAGKGSERSFQDGVLTWGTARFVDLGIWVPAFLRFRFTIVTITQELPFKFGVLWYLIFSFSKFYVSKPLEPSLGVENIHLHPEWLYQLISYSSVIRGTGFWPTAIYPSSPQYGYVQKHTQILHQNCNFNVFNSIGIFSLL